MKQHEKRLKEIEKEFIKVALIDAPGTILFGLGLYGKFAADGDAFIPMLNNQQLVNAFLLLGAAIMAWGAFMMIKLAKEKSRLQNLQG
ncbi:hypothetical protein [Arsukibacterium sp.]|uniref:hypothetical protein n=1 Tax=Arsukibacterium sp. TaxID=1977258 RepID=UPI002FD9C931